MAVADFHRDDVENDGKKKVPADENLTNPLMPPFIMFLKEGCDAL